MTEFQTLHEALIARRGSSRAVHYIEGERVERRLELRELHSRALGLLHHFQNRGAEPGSEMILLVDSNEQFIDAFWACVAGGIIAVPIAPGITDEQRAKFFRVLQQLKQPSLCSDTKTHARLAAFAAANGLSQEIVQIQSRTTFLDQVEDISQAGNEHSASPADIAFLQYSSGSTSEPKGVMLTHRNLTANVAAIIAGAAITSDDSTLSWMPLTHDMGLIGFHLVPLVGDLNQYLMPTSLFVRRPKLWLAKASEKRATLLCSPNFGYRHLLRNYKGSNGDELDLSAVRVLFNGAEPISVELCDEFLNVMSAHHLSKQSMFPVYGLAEASLAATFPQPGIPYQRVAVDRRTLSVATRVKLVSADHPQAVTLACVGKAVANCAFSIRNDDGGELEDGIVGRILIRGENVTSGFYADPQTTCEVISADGWLDTGDVGFVSASGLVVTGRRKDILFISGQNYYPQDLEALLERHAGIDLGKAAVTGVRPQHAEADKALVFVLSRDQLSNFVPTAKRVRKCINEQLGIAVDHVLPTAKIPKTTSGKIQRYLLAQAYESGEFDEVIAALKKCEDGSEESTGALSDIERTLKEICDAFLTDRPLAVNDNIFELGTSSLTLAQIYQRIETVYPGRIEVTDFFDYPTIAELAKYLEKRLAT